MLRNKDVSCILPFVRRIEFTPGRYTWDMDIHYFRHVLERQELLLRCDALSIDRATVDRMSHGEFIKTYLKGNPPCDEDEVQHCYRVYMANARKIHDLFRQQTFQNAWAAFLSKVPSVKDFRIGYLDCRKSDRYNDRVRYNFFAHQHFLGSRLEKECLAQQAAVGKALFSASMAALKQAGMSVTRLDVAHVIDVYNLEIAELHGFDSSKLTSICFRPLNRLGSEEGAEEDGDHEARGSVQLLQLLERCSQSLADLEVSTMNSGSYVSFPPFRMPTLPNLTRLYLGSAIRLSSLAELIRRSTKLRELSLYPSETTGSWRDVWRAIKHHGNNIRLDCCILCCYSGEWFDVQGWKRGEPTERFEETDVLSVDKHPSILKQRSILKYLSNQGSWDRHCKRAFELFQGEEEDETPSDDSEGAFGKPQDDDGGWEQ